MRRRLNENSRAQALGALAERLPEPERDGVVSEALDAARAVSGEHGRWVR